MPTITKNYYVVLHVSPSATAEEIKGAYRKEAFVCHPDRGGSPSRMREVNEAWGVLGDVERRRAYDLERRLDGAGVLRVGQVESPDRRQAKAGAAESNHPLTAALFSVLRPIAFRAGQGVSRVRRFFRRLFDRR